jgi:spermidine/putrescine transport system ATP-binding protein
VRPEKILLRTEQDPPPPDRCALRVDVTEVVYLGTSTQYRAATGAGQAVAVYRQNASANPGADVLAGQVGWLEWSPEHSYVLGGGTKEGTSP